MVQYQIYGGGETDGEVRDSERLENYKEVKRFFLML